MSNLRDFARGLKIGQDFAEPIAQGLARRYENMREDAFRQDILRRQQEAMSRQLLMSPGVNPQGSFSDSVGLPGTGLTFSPQAALGQNLSATEQELALKNRMNFDQAKKTSGFNQETALAEEERQRGLARPAASFALGQLPPGTVPPGDSGPIDPLTAIEGLGLAQGLAPAGVDVGKPHGSAYEGSDGRRYQDFVLPDGRTEARPVEGAPPSEDTKKTQQAMASQKEKAERVINKVDEAIEKINMRSAGPLSTIGGAFNVEATNLKSELDTIEAILSFSELQKMRAESKTGGALGQVAVRELELLGSVVASLKQEQLPEQLRKNLNQIKEHSQKWLDAVSQAGRTGGDGTSQAGSSARKDKFGFSNGEVKTAPDGKEYEYLGNNQWRPKR